MHAIQLKVIHALELWHNHQEEYKKIHQKKIWLPSTPIPCKPFRFPLQFQWLCIFTKLHLCLVIYLLPAHQWRLAERMHSNGRALTAWRRERPRTRLSCGRSTPATARGTPASSTPRRVCGMPLDSTIVS